MAQGGRWGGVVRQGRRHFQPAELQHHVVAALRAPQLALPPAQRLYLGLELARLLAPRLQLRCHLAELLPRLRHRPARRAAARGHPHRRSAVLAFKRVGAAAAATKGVAVVVVVGAAKGVAAGAAGARRDGHLGQRTQRRLGRLGGARRGIHAKGRDGQVVVVGVGVVPDAHPPEPARAEHAAQRDRAAGEDEVERLGHRRGARKLR